MKSIANTIPAAVRPRFRGSLVEALFVEVEAHVQFTRSAWESADRFMVVDDVLRLKELLPFPSSALSEAEIEGQIRALLANCQSPVLRRIPPATIRHSMDMAARGC